MFADWLDERGDPLGEFIRVQVELSHRQDRLGDEETQRLLDREDELQEECWAGWTDLWELHFRRGLPEKIRLSDLDFPDAFSSVLDAWPTIRTLSLGSPRAIQGIANCPHLSRAWALHLEGWHEPEVVEALLDSPYWNAAATLRLNLHAQGPAPQLLDLPSQVALSRLELVQPFAGSMVGRDGQFFDNAIIEIVQEFNYAVGRDWALLLRPYERLFPLLGDLGGRFFAGHLKSGAAALFGIAPPGRRVAFCTFTDTGRVDKSLWEDTTDPPWTRDRLRVRFGFELGFIRVREFEANNRLAVRFWPRAAQAIIADSTYDYDPEIAAHLADPVKFAVGFGEREVDVAYRTGRGTGAVG